MSQRQVLHAAPVAKVRPHVWESSPAPDRRSWDSPQCHLPHDIAVRPVPQDKAQGSSSVPSVTPAPGLIHLQALSAVVKSGPVSALFLSPPITLSCGTWTTALALGSRKVLLGQWNPGRSVPRPLSIPPPAGPPALPRGPSSRPSSARALSLPTCSAAAPTSPHPPLSSLRPRAQESPPCCRPHGFPAGASDALHLMSNLRLTPLACFLVYCLFSGLEGGLHEAGALLLPLSSRFSSSWSQCSRMKSLFPHFQFFLLETRGGVGPQRPVVPIRQACEAGVSAGQEASRSKLVCTLAYGIYLNFGFRCVAPLLL